MIVTKVTELGSEAKKIQAILASPCPKKDSNVPPKPEKHLMKGKKTRINRINPENHGWKQTGRPNKLI